MSSHASVAPQRREDGQQGPFLREAPYHTSHMQPLGGTLGNGGTPLGTYYVTPSLPGGCSPVPQNGYHLTSGTTAMTAATTPVFLNKRRCERSPDGAGGTVLQPLSPLTHLSPSNVLVQATHGKLHSTPHSQPTTTAATTSTPTEKQQRPLPKIYPQQRHKTSGGRSRSHAPGAPGASPNGYDKAGGRRKAKVGNHPTTAGGGPAAAVGRRDSHPPEDTATYQSLDVTQFPSNQPQRGPRRRAVVVGVNYVLTPDILLRGGCNDAAAMALTLLNLCDFTPEDVILLVDSFPATCYRQSPPREGERPGEFIPWKDRQPSRRNILLALNWLRADTMPGDVLFFYFAGHGIQVDDMSGWEGEGYDEAILPMDFYGEEVNAITAVMVRNLLLSVANDVQVTMVLDCNGGQTMLDPAGTGKWNFIKGVKQRGVWPFVTDATDKVARAVYDQAPWMDEAMKRRGARPRFVPGVDVSSTQDLLDPTLQKPSAQVAVKVKGYLFAAAPWSQSAIEAKMTSVKLVPIDRKGRLLREGRPSDKHSCYHGVFTWCFLNALQELLVQAVGKTRTKGISYRRLLEETETRGLPKLNQYPELTFYRSGGGDGRDFFLWPFGGRRSGVSYSQRPTSSVRLPCIPHEQQYLSTWEAEEQLRRAGEIRRRNDPAFMLLRRIGLGSYGGTSPYPVEPSAAVLRSHDSTTANAIGALSAAGNVPGFPQEFPGLNATQPIAPVTAYHHLDTRPRGPVVIPPPPSLTAPPTQRTSTLSTTTGGPIESQTKLPSISSFVNSRVERFTSCPQRQHLESASKPHVLMARSPQEATTLTATASPDTPQSDTHADVTNTSTSVSASFVPNPPPKVTPLSLQHPIIRNFTVPAQSFLKKPPPVLHQSGQAQTHIAVTPGPTATDHPLSPPVVTRAVTGAAVTPTAAGASSRSPVSYTLAPLNRSGVTRTPIPVFFPGSPSGLSKTLSTSPGVKTQRSSPQASDMTRDNPMLSGIPTAHNVPLSACDGDDAFYAKEGQLPSSGIHGAVSLGTTTAPQYMTSAHTRIK